MAGQSLMVDYDVMEFKVQRLNVQVSLNYSEWFKKTEF